MAGELLNLGDVVAHFRADTKQFTKGVGEAERSIGGLMKSATAGSQAIAAGLAAAGAAAGAFIGQGIKLAGQLETNRIGFITLLGSAEKADEALKMIKKDAASTPFELPGLIQANQLLTAVTKDAPRSERMLLNVGKALSAMGKGQNELDRIIVNLQQVGAVGKASMIDIKQFAFAGIPIFEMLKETLQVSGAELEDMISNGEITFDVLEKLFNEAGEGGGKFAKAFDNANGSFEQLMSNAKDNLNMFLVDFVKATGIFDMAKNVLRTFMEALGRIGTILNESGIRGLWEQLVPSWVRENIHLIAGALIGALVPAIWAAVAGLWGLFAPLVPFIALGVGLAALLKRLDIDFGAVRNTIQSLINYVKVFVQEGDYMNDFLMDLPEPIIAIVRWLHSMRDWIGFVIDYFKLLWQTVKELMIPQLEMLREAIEPFIPVLIMFAKIIGVTLVAAVVGLVTGIAFAAVGIVTAIRMIVEWFAKMYAEAQQKIDFIVLLFTNFPLAIKQALSGLYAAITEPFKRAFDKVKQMADEVWEKLQKINPFHRESPSLVDNVKAGIKIIAREYASLGSMTPALGGIGAGLASTVGAGGFSQSINVNVQRADSEQDWDSIGREIGFRASINPRFRPQL